MTSEGKTKTSDQKLPLSIDDTVDPPKRPSLVAFFQRLTQRFSRALVQEVPPELDACETCRETECSQHRFDHCEQRLEKERLRRKYRV